MGPFEQDDDPPLLCLSCGGPLRNRDGKFALDIFALIGRGARSMGRQRFKAHDLVFRLAIRTAEIGVRHGASIARGCQGRSPPNVGLFRLRSSPDIPRDSVDPSEESR